MSKKKIVIYLIIVVVIILAFWYLQNQKNSDEMKLKCPLGQQVYYSNCSCGYVCVEKVPEQESRCSISKCMLDY